MKKQFCAHFCGAPFTGSIWRARIRAPMKRMASMGAKFIDSVAALQGRRHGRDHIAGPRALRRLEVDDAVHDHQRAGVQAEHDQGLESREAPGDDGLAEGLLVRFDVAGLDIN